MPTSKNLVGMGHTSHWKQDNPGQSSQSLVRCLGQPPLWQLTRTKQFHMRTHLISHHTTDPWGTLVTSSKEIPLWVAGIHHYSKHHKINYSLTACSTAFPKGLTTAQLGKTYTTSHALHTLPISSVFLYGLSIMFRTDYITQYQTTCAKDDWWAVNWKECRGKWSYPRTHTVGWGGVFRS